MVVDEGGSEDEVQRGLEPRGTPGQRSSSIEHARGPARWCSGGRAREDEVVGSTGFDLVVGEEGREEATMEGGWLGLQIEEVGGSTRWMDRGDPEEKVGVWRRRNGKDGTRCLGFRDWSSLYSKGIRAELIWILRSKSSGCG